MVYAAFGSQCFAFLPWKGLERIGVDESPFLTKDKPKSTGSSSPPLAQQSKAHPTLIL